MYKFDDDFVRRLVAFARFALERHELKAGPGTRKAGDYVLDAVASFLEQNDPGNDPSQFKKIARIIVDLIKEDLC